MMNRRLLTLRGLLVLLLLVLPSISFAEGGCPQGQYPQNGQGWQSCVPIPGANANGSSQTGRVHVPSKWSEKWGAVATGGKDHLGISSELPSKDAAIEAAVEECKSRGGINCRMSHVYANQCIAVIGRPDAPSDISDGSNEKEAVQLGMAKCDQEGLSGCWVYYSGCSLPIEVPQ